MAKSEITDSKLLRVKLAIQLNHYVERMKIFMAEEMLAGSSVQEIRKMRNDKLSAWAKERDALKNEIKRAVAGFINKVHAIAYQEDL